MASEICEAVAALVTRGGNQSRQRATPQVLEAALDAYEQAIQLVPREASFYHHKAHILEQLGRLAEAKRASEQAKWLGYNG